jgi:hypothetical protein
MTSRRNLVRQWLSNQISKTFFDGSEGGEILPSPGKTDSVGPTVIFGISELDIVVFPAADWADIKSARWLFL